MEKDKEFEDFWDSIDDDTLIRITHQRVPVTSITDEVMDKIKDAVALGIYLHMAREDLDLTHEQVMNRLNIDQDQFDRGIIYLKDIGLIVSKE